MNTINDLQSKGPRPRVKDESTSPVEISLLPISDRPKTSKTSSRRSDSPGPPTPRPVTPKPNDGPVPTPSPPPDVDIIQRNTDVFAVWLDMDGFAYEVCLCSRLTNRCSCDSTGTSKVIARLNHPLESCLFLGTGLRKTER